MPASPPLSMPLHPRCLWALGLAVLVIPHRAAGQVDTAVVPSPFTYNRRTPLEPTDTLLRTASGEGVGGSGGRGGGGVAVHAISFASPKGGRATGLLFVPRDSGGGGGGGRFAGIVVQHGASASAREMERVALTIARRGAVVVAVDAPFARRNETPFRFTPQDSADQVQLIVDLQRAVDLLVARRDVDPRRLAYVGQSYGAAMGALFAGVERRLATYVLQVGDGGLVSHFTGPDDLPGPLRGVSEPAWKRWLAAMNPIEPIRYVGRAPPASLYFQSARRDELIPLMDADRLHKAARAPKAVSWYDSGHGLNEAAMTDMLGWLQRTVGLRAPD